MAQHPKVVSFRRSSEAPPEEYINENSPLIRPRMSGEVDVDSLYNTVSPLDSEDWDGQGDEEETKSSLFMFLLTLGGLGLQIGWSVETSNGSVSMPCCCRIVSDRHSPIFYLSASANPCSHWYGSLARCLVYSCNHMWA